MKAGTAWIETISRGAIAPTQVLAAAGHNFSLFLRWLEWLLRVFVAALTQPLAVTRSA